MPSLDSTNSLHRNGQSTGFLGCLLLFATVAIFWPASNNDFVHWDDDFYVYNEPQILKGICSDGLRWAMTACVVNNWHPLTLISLQLDAHLFGPQPIGFHRTAVFMHAINSILAFVAIFGLTGSRWRSFVVAALFALHPLRVESVAWVSERKDLLSGTFFFLTIIAYSRYCKSPTLGKYLLVALSLAMGLCAKSMLVTTPCVLLLLDFWPLGRLRVVSVDAKAQFSRLVIEKLPLLGLSALMSAITVVYQQTALINLAKLPLECRIENAVRGCVGYLQQTVWPTSLSAFYPIPPASLPKLLMAVIVLFGMTTICCWQRRQRPYLLVGWLWFIGMLVPVSGLIQVGIQQRADRYTYLPHVGLFMAVVWTAADLFKNSRVMSRTLFCISMLIAIGFGVLSTKQVEVWRDTKTLWQHAHSVDSSNFAASCYLIPYLFADGCREQALQLANEAIAIDDRFERDGLLHLSDCLAQHGEFAAAVRALEKAMIDCYDSKLFIRRGESLGAIGKWDLAIDDYRRAIQLSPDTIPFQFCLAHALAKNGNIDEAKRIRSAAIARSPRWPETAARMAWEMTTNTDSDQQILQRAVCLAEEANAVTGGNQSQFLDVLAAAYAGIGQFDLAVETTEKGIQRAELEQQTGYAKELRTRLEPYKQRKRYRRSE